MMSDGSVFAWAQGGAGNYNIQIEGPTTIFRFPATTGLCAGCSNSYAYTRPVASAGINPLPTSIVASLASDSITLSPVASWTTTPITNNFYTAPCAPSAFSVIASGTAATITNTPGALAFGTQSPTVTLIGAASLPYWIEYHVRPNLAAATFAAIQNVQCYLYRTNNTAGTLGNTTRTSLIPIATTTTLELGSIQAGTAYTSSGANDAISLYCGLSASAAAGSVTAVGASIEATGLFQ